MNRNSTMRFQKPLLNFRIASVVVSFLVAAMMLPTSGLAADKTVVSVAYSANFMFDTDELAVKWWEGVKAQYEKKYPDRTLRLVPIGGGYDDILSKLSLLYRSPSTTPDVVQLSTPAIAKWVSADYLLPLDNYVKGASWWADFPQVIKDVDTFNGKVYAVSSGVNVSLLYYNKNIFKKAGITVPWNPKNWDDVLAAARQVKQKVPDVYPLWLMAGTSAGSVGIEMGSGNLLFGSSDPTVHNSKTNKWVVDSKGLREVFAFYKAVYGEGLGVPLSYVFSPSAVTVPVTDIIPKGKVAIAFGSNFYGGQWGKVVCGPCWPEANDVEGVLPIPTNKGQAPNVATTVAGWDFVISKATQHPKEAWDLINLMQNEENNINMANWAGFVPGSAKYTKLPVHLDFGPPVNKVAADVLRYGKILPPLPDFEVWSKGMQSATGALAQHPDKTSVDDAIGVLKDYVTNQLGKDKVEIRK